VAALTQDSGTHPRTRSPSSSSLYMARCRIIVMSTYGDHIQRLFTSLEAPIVEQSSTTSVTLGNHHPTDRRPLRGTARRSCDASIRTTVVHHKQSKRRETKSGSGIISVFITYKSGKGGRAKRDEHRIGPQCASRPPPAWSDLHRIYRQRLNPDTGRRRCTVGDNRYPNKNKQTTKSRVINVCSRLHRPLCSSIVQSVPVAQRSSVNGPKNSYVR